MAYTTKTGPCALTCWVLGFLAAAIAVGLFKSSVGFIILAVIAAVVGVATAYVLKMVLCKGGDDAADAGGESFGGIRAEKAAAPVGGISSGGTPAAAAAAPTPAPAPKPAPAPEPAAASDTPDFDGDGVHEGTAEGSQPATLSAARDGKGDDLKQIKGVGPKMEKMLNDMGFFHFDQVAAWNADEVAWVNANLKGFKGRVSRDNWVDQAKTLAAGGETEFSKRVEDGGVY